MTSTRSLLLNGSPVRRNGRRPAPRIGTLPLGVTAPESFRLSPDHSTVWRTILRRDGTAHTTAFPLPRPLRGTPVEHRLAELADAAFLRSCEWPQVRRAGGTIRVVDLFSGCGAMSLGVWEACRAIGMHFKTLLAVDSEPFAARIYKRNFPSARVECVDLNFASEEDTWRALAMANNLEFVDPVSLELKRETLELVPIKFIFNYHLLPLGVEDDSLTLAFSEPPRAMEQGKYRLVYVAPERFNNERFLSLLRECRRVISTHA